MKNNTLKNTYHGDLYVKAWDFNQTDDRGKPNSVRDRTPLETKGSRRPLRSGELHFKW